MKILNNIGCALNSIESNSIQQLDWFELNWIKKKRDANWSRRYWKIACKHDVGKKLLKATNPIERLCIHFYLAMG
jgi:hypothetical protein